MKIPIKVPEAFEPISNLSQHYRYRGAYGGRGSGKSHRFAEMVVEYAATHPGSRIVCLREVQKTLRDSVYSLIRGKLDTLPLPAKLRNQFQTRAHEILTPGGGIITFQGLQDATAESIKSLEGFSAYVEEAQTISTRSLELLRPTIRTQGSWLWFAWNPRLATDPVDQLLRGENPPSSSVVVNVNWPDNPYWNEEMEAERLHDQTYFPGRYLHVWEGHYEPQAVGAIFSRAIIAQNRRSIDEIPAMKRILVSVDPAISAEALSDENGIVCVGLGEDDRGYLLADESGIATPAEWAARAIAMLDQYEADAIVYEENQGGLMVEHTLQTARPGVKTIPVRATRAKHVRAEPISGLYAVGKVSHVGTFPKLESQLMGFTPSGYELEGSPDRAEAAIWGFTELFPKLVKRAPRPVAQTRANGTYQPHRWREAGRNEEYQRA